MKNTKNVVVVGLVSVFLSGMLVGCTKVTYYKQVTTHYDASGYKTGVDVTEGINQMEPNSQAFKVNITQKKVLEK